MTVQNSHGINDRNPFPPPGVTQGEEIVNLRSQVADLTAERDAALAALQAEREAVKAAHETIAKLASMRDVARQMPPDVVEQLRNPPQALSDASLHNLRDGTIVCVAKNGYPEDPAAVKRAGEGRE